MINDPAELPKLIRDPLDICLGRTIQRGHELAGGAERQDVAVVSHGPRNFGLAFRLARVDDPCETPDANGCFGCSQPPYTLSRRLELKRSPCVSDQAG
jgi:hypothetical protein